MRTERPPSNARRGALVILIFALAGLASPLAFARGGAAVTDFSDWHLPLPAGPWWISRGPCGSAAGFTHDCRYYEERCALDLISAFGSMEGVPVLAPQAGRVFFLGTRADAGLTVMLEHPDGRVSAFMHLSQAVVGPDEPVAQGQVLGYAGSTGSSGNPHLHFFVQPNGVERECVEVNGLDEVNHQTLTATSRNLAWTQLALPDPSAPVPDWLVRLSAPPSSAGVVLPERVVLAPGAQFHLPVLVMSESAPAWLISGRGWLKPVPSDPGPALFDLPVTASGKKGEFLQTWDLRAARGRARERTFSLRVSVRPPPDTSPGQGAMLINPEFVSPQSFASFSAAPRLCWTISPSAGPPPLRFRVLVVGASAADSGWIADTCWQPPPLAVGTYYWKVLARDAQGYMNRTNQRPSAFIIR